MNKFLFIKKYNIYLIYIMFKFTDYINPLAFFIALAIGLLITYIFNPQKKIIIKWPNPENVGKIVYKENDSCYKYNAKEIKCPSDKSLIKKKSTEYL
jgi:hypothetical protein